MRLDKYFPDNSSFNNPDVSDRIIKSIIEYFNSNDESHPREVICSVAKRENVSKKTVRKGVRKMKMNNIIVPTEPFVGKLELAIDPVDK